MEHLASLLPRVALHLLALTCLWCALPALADSYYTYDEYSNPQGLITEVHTTLPAGTAVRTAIAPLSSGGYAFAYWTVNGALIVDPIGQARVRADFYLLGNSTSVASYVSTSLDSDGDGTPDYTEWRYYASLTNGPASDVDGDGFSHALEMQRGYNPAIYDDLRDGGLMLRLSDSTKLRDDSVMKRYDIRSDPQGMVTESSGYDTNGTVRYTPTLAKGSGSGGYVFGYWEVNGVRQAAGSGLALSKATLVMTQDVVAIARHFASSADSDGDGLYDWEEWYWFGNTNNTLASDPDGDGFTIADERARGYTLNIYDELRDGGLMLRLSDSAKLRDDSVMRRYEIRSDPQGIVTESSGYDTNGTVRYTPTLAKSSGASGYTFGYWEVNGVRQAAGSGLALSKATLVMTQDVVAIARHFPATADSEADGLYDWEEWYWFGNTNNSLTSDPDSDGFTIADERARGYTLNIYDELRDGGIMLRLSDSATLRDDSLMRRYEIRSDPQGIVTESSGYDTNGTARYTTALAKGSGLNGYVFAYWEVNGVRQAAGSGLALSKATLVMTQDVVAIARHFPSSADSDGDGLYDWEEWYWFGNTNNSLTSDPDGDGFTIADERARGYTLNIYDELRDGGIMLRLSDSATLAMPYFPRITATLIDNQSQTAFSNPGETNGILTMPRNSHPALGDWDGDGDLDLFIGGSNPSAGSGQGGTMRIFENAGSPRVLNLVERTTNFAGIAFAWTNILNPAPALGDWSGDGKADLAIGGSTSSIVLVQSSGSFSTNPVSSFEFPVSGIPAFADVNHDGWTDLLVLTPAGLVSAYTNSHSALTPYPLPPYSTNLLGTAVPNATGITAADVDGDGIPDVLISDDHGNIWEFHATGGGP